jgi:PAS domain S-box-containing protein
MMTWFSSRSRRLHSYVVAILFVALAVLLRRASPGVLRGAPYLAFYPACVFAATFGGLGPGMLAVISSWLCVELLFDATPGQIDIHDPVVLGRFVVFLIGGLGVSLLAEFRLRSQARERKAEESVRYQSALVASSGDAIIGKTLDGRVTSWNEGAELLYGYSAEEMMGKPISILMPDEPADDLADILQRVAAGQRVEQYETVRKRKDGQLLQVFLKVSPIIDNSGAVIGASSIARDITDRKQAEEALKRSEAQFRTLANAIPQLCWMANSDGWIFWYNDRWYEYTGTTPEQMKGWGWQSVHDPQVLPSVLDRWKASIATGNPFEMVFPLRGADGVLRSFLTRVMPVKDTAGKVVRWFGTNTDVSAQRQAEEALRQSETRYRALFDSMDEGYCIIEVIFDQNDRPVDYRFLETNPAFDKQTGLINAQGKRMRELAPNHEDHWFEIYGRVALTGEPSRTESRAEQLQRWFDVYAFRFSEPEKRQVAILFNDITERKHTEQALMRSEKLASVGRMAATISHEINNPLATAINALYLVKTEPALPECVKDNLALAEQELGRVSHISKQTLGFYREMGNPTAVDLAEVLDSVLDTYGPRLRNKNISLLRSYRSSSNIRAVEGEIRQIASNLVVNCIDALPENGKLHVRLYGPQTLRGNRRMIRMTIADNGEGISTENQKLIFEPFFTNKASIGTGLGLWVTSELVRKHEGKIRIRSKLGKGTIATVWLPMERRGQERRSG